MSDLVERVAHDLGEKICHAKDPAEIALLIRAALAELERLKDEWVSVEERLPEEDGEVLVLRGSGRRMEAYWQAKSDCGVDREFWNRNKWPWTIMSDVTDWQPLPAPPRKEVG